MVWGVLRCDLSFTSHSFLLVAIVLLKSFVLNITAQFDCFFKAHPDERILVDKMKRTAVTTAPYRQKMCLEQPSSAVLENFPCLQHHAFVCIFFTCVTFPLSCVNSGCISLQISKLT